VIESEKCILIGPTKAGRTTGRIRAVRASRGNKVALVRQPLVHVPLSSQTNALVGRLRFLPGRLKRRHGILAPCNREHLG